MQAQVAPSRVFSCLRRRLGELCRRGVSGGVSVLAEWFPRGGRGTWRDRDVLEKGVEARMGV